MAPLSVFGFLLLFVFTQPSASESGSMRKHAGSELSPDGHGLMRVKALSGLVVQSDGQVFSHTGSTRASELYAESALVDKRLDAIPRAVKKRIFGQLVEASSHKPPRASKLAKAKLHRRGRRHSSGSLVQVSRAKKRNAAPRCAESARDADFASLADAPFVHFTANGHDAMIRGVNTPSISGSVYALAEWCLTTGSSEYAECNCSKVQAFNLERLEMDTESGTETSADMGVEADGDPDVGTGAGAGIAADTTPTSRSDVTGAATDAEEDATQPLPGEGTDAEERVGAASANAGEPDVAGTSAGADAQEDATQPLPGEGTDAEERPNSASAHAEDQVVAGTNAGADVETGGETETATDAGLPLPVEGANAGADAGAGAGSGAGTAAGSGTAADTTPTSGSDFGGAPPDAPDDATQPVSDEGPDVEQRVNYATAHAGEQGATNGEQIGSKAAAEDEKDTANIHHVSTWFTTGIGLALFYL